jgi:hypothetical protein
MTEIREDGGMHLCSMDMRLWGLVHTAALQWHTQIMFKWDGMNVPEKRNEFIRFFVPKDSSYRYEIIQFLKGHLDKMQEDPRTFVLDGEDHYFPGTECNIYPAIYTFNGVPPQRPQEVSEGMIKELTQQFMLELGTPKRKQRAVDKAKKRLMTDPVFAEKVLESLGTVQIEKLLEVADA